MTVTKATRCGGFAAVVARQRLHSAQQLDITTIRTLHQPYNIVVSFNDKDQLQLATKQDPSDEDKKLQKFEPKTLKQEHISIDNIDNCVNIENYPNCSNTLVFYVTKNGVKEAIALKFENEQDFKRIYFTFKYFKMRNSLTKKPNYLGNENIFPKKKYDVFQKTKNIDEYNKYDTGNEFDLLKTDYDGVTHITVQQKNSRYDQPLSLIGIRNDVSDIGEIDSIIYTDLDIKSDRKRLPYKKPKAPPPPKDPPKVLKGEFVRVNIDRAPDIIPKENIKLSRMPDILLFRDSKLKRNNVTSNLRSNNNKVSGYESDREEWRGSRSQFSTTAFDSLARPTKAAMALTLRKPRLPDLHYYRLPSERAQLTPPAYRPNPLRPPTLPRPTEIKRPTPIFNDRRFQSLQNLDSKPIEPKKQEAKKNSNISNRITGITNKLRDLGRPNTLGRFKAQSHGDVSLKPVLKHDCAKRSVVRTCSAEPPKKLKYPSGVEASQGNELTPTQVKEQPSVSYEAEPDSYYTLIFTDPDNYDGPEKVYREWHHWLVTNIPGDDVSAGEVLSGYIGSGPPEGTGIHRYVYILYKQPGKLQFDEKRLNNKSVDGRAAFSTKKFAEKYKLGAPVAGNFYRAQFDDYVPQLYKSLGV